MQYSIDDLKHLTVASLKEELAKLDLPTSGKKAELQQRLVEATQSIRRASISIPETAQISPRKCRSSPRQKKPAADLSSPVKKSEISPRKATSPQKTFQSPEKKLSSPSKQKSPDSAKTLKHTASEKPTLIQPVSTTHASNLTATANGTKKKKKRKKRHPDYNVSKDAGPTLEEESSEGPPEKAEIEIEYTPEDLSKVLAGTSREILDMFANVFEKFSFSAASEKNDGDETSGDNSGHKVPETVIYESKQAEEAESDSDQEEKEAASKKKLKKKNRLTISQLKQLVEHPDIVEMWDVTAENPKFLVYLKSYRNTVAVPSHWCLKSKFMQGKRGIEKAPFNLPDFIKNTGIMEMREAVTENNDQKSLKQRSREKVRPKIGRCDVDYQKLHDAFFRYQTKPPMTPHGDLYYEGKELEAKPKFKKPGNLSEELRAALGMPIGPGSELIPPPWLIAQQRYGPPPSYPYLRIRGLNAPIPAGASFGYHPGGWGKPPVDEHGVPLYGDVFEDPNGGSENGVGTNFVSDGVGGHVGKSEWGYMNPGEYESEQSDQEQDSSQDGDQDEADVDGERIEKDAAGLETPIVQSGFASVASVQGLQTPSVLELRKRKLIEDQMDEGEISGKSLYTIVPEKTVSSAATAGKSGILGTQHVYDISQVSGAGRKNMPASFSGASGVELSLDPSNLDVLENEALLKNRYDEKLKEANQSIRKEDFSSMVNEHIENQNKRKKRAGDFHESKTDKKYKEFKF
eukprot:Sdes_comp20509_c0_seq1m15013